MFPSTLYIMLTMHLQSLKLLSQKVKEEMHIQENTLFDLWPWPWGQGHYEMLPSTLYIMWLMHLQSLKCYFKRFRRRCIYKKIHLTFDIGIKVTQNVVLYPLYHVAYSATKFEVAMSNDLGGDTFTRNVTEKRRTNFGTKFIYPFFSKEKSRFITIMPKSWPNF